VLQNWKREKQIRRVLRDLAKQRVALILHPGNVWVVENALEQSQSRVAEALATCRMRGWIEVMENALPTGKLPPSMDVHEIQFDRNAPIYGLTESGWNVIRGAHTWVKAAFAVSLGSALAALGSVYVAGKASPTAPIERYTTVVVPIMTPCTAPPATTSSLQTAEKRKLNDRRLIAPRPQP